MTVKEKIIQELFKKPGLSDTELTTIIYGKDDGLNSNHQIINQACRALGSEGKLKREKSTGNIQNYLTDCNIEITPPPSQTESQTVISMSKTNKKTILHSAVKLFKTIFSVHSVQPNLNSIIVVCGYEFIKTELLILKRNIPSPFLRYNRRTVEEMLLKRHYHSLSNMIYKQYSDYISYNIQDFIKALIQKRDIFYKSFLNVYGEEKFCEFKLNDSNILDKRGIYAFVINDKIMYIGRCCNSFNNRFNINYGKVSPINCYKEGQSTNCHINSIINKYADNINIYLYIMKDESEIIKLEETLIHKINPEWNIRKY